MDYRAIGNEIYIRIDKDEDILESILAICKKENIQTANFRGIGCCRKIDIQTYIPQKEEFISHIKTGIFEMLSLDGNISPENDGSLFLHAHSTFSYLENGEIKMIGGHLKEAIVEYTAEIILNPAQETIARMIDPKTNISVWDLKKN
jgi:hypothetical protein